MTRNKHNTVPLKHHTFVSKFENGSVRIERRDHPQLTPAFQILQCGISIPAPIDYYTALEIHVT